MFGDMNHTNKVQALRSELEALNAEAAQLVRDPQWLTEQAQQIGDQIWESFQSDNLISRFSDVRSFARDGDGTIETIKGLSAFHVARGGYIEESTIQSEITHIQKDQIGIHFVEHLDRLEVNFVPTAQRLIELSARRIDAEINRRVLSVFQAAVDVGSDNYIYTPGITLAQLDDAIASVEDAASYGLGTPAPVIIARPQMIRKLVAQLTNNGTYTAFLPETNEELFRRGLIGSYRGTPIIRLDNHKDEYGRSYFPADELWVISRDAAITGFFGTPRTHNYQEQGTEYWHFIDRIDYGVTVLFPDHAFRIVDGSIAG